MAPRLPPDLSPYRSPHHSDALALLQTHEAAPDPYGSLSPPPELNSPRHPFGSICPSLRSLFRSHPHTHPIQNSSALHPRSLSPRCPCICFFTACITARCGLTHWMGVSSHGPDSVRHTAGCSQHPPNAGISEHRRDLVFPTICFLKCLFASFVDSFPPPPIKLEYPSPNSKTNTQTNSNRNTSIGIIH